MVFFATRGLLTKSYNPVFAENEWSAIIEACHANEVPDEWVADGTCYKDMLINGTNYRIDIIGKNHDDLSDGTGKAPLTFQLHDCYATTYQIHNANSNVGGWTGCNMRNIHLPAILELMPSDVRSGIREVQKLTGNSSGNILTTNDKLFLLSEIELYGDIGNSLDGEGTQYSYYKSGVNTRIKNVNGIASFWWTRSPDYELGNYFVFISIDGSRSEDFARTHMGASFAFCF